jgi:hypothetical protein
MTTDVACQAIDRTTEAELQKQGESKRSKECKSKFV